MYVFDHLKFARVFFFNQDVLYLDVPWALEKDAHPAAAVWVVLCVTLCPVG